MLIMNVFHSYYSLNTSSAIIMINLFSRQEFEFKMQMKQTIFIAQIKDYYMNYAQFILKI